MLLLDTSVNNSLNGNCICVDSVDLKSYSSDFYTAPTDGYIHALVQTTNGYVQFELRDYNDNYIGVFQVIGNSSSYAMGGIFVRKGTKIKFNGYSGNVTNATFRSITLS